MYAILILSQSSKTMHLNSAHQSMKSCVRCLRCTSAYLADSIQNVSTAPEGLGWVFFGFFEMSVLADSVFDRGTANVED